MNEIRRMRSFLVSIFLAPVLFGAGASAFVAEEPKPASEPGLQDRLVAALRASEFLEADRLAARLLQDPATDPHATALCGLAVLKAGRLREAEALFERVIARSPDDPEAHFGLGWIDRSRNDLEAAIPHLRKAVPSVHFYDEILRMLWRAAWDRGSVDDLLEVHRVIAERYGRESKPAPDGFAGPMAQLEGLAGQTLFAMKGGAGRFSVPLVKRENSDIRMISFTLNGKGEYLFDIDSAARDFMTISPLLAEELGLALAGSSTAVGVGSASSSVRYAMLESVRLGEVEFRKVPVMVSDLVTFRGLKKGLIGTGLLRRFNVTIDVRAGAADFHPLERPDLFRRGIDPAAVAVEVPLLLFDATTVEASLAGAPTALFILDTAAGTHLVDADFFREHLQPGLDPNRIAADRILGAGGAQDARRITGLPVTLGPLVLPGQGVNEFSMKILNSIGGRYTAGLLGHPILWPYRVHMDFRGGRLILERHPGTTAAP